MSPVVRIHRAKKPRGEVELTPFITTPGTSLQKLSAMSATGSVI